MTIHENMQVYKNKEELKPNFRCVRDFSTSTAYETVISLHLHTGTHVDSPLHMLPDGKTIDTIGLEDLVGPARVLDLTQVKGGIGREHLEPFAIQRGEWILLKTNNSFSEEFDFEFVFLNEHGAAYLQEIGVKGVGIDSLGIERSQEGHPTHKTLMKNGIIIVEGLRLKDVPAGSYFMVIAPLKLSGVEAAPARAFLIGH